jgi:hypothetical protein
MPRQVDDFEELGEVTLKFQDGRASIEIMKRIGVRDTATGKVLSFTKHREAIDLNPIDSDEPSKSLAELARARVSELLGSKMAASVLKAVEQAK